MVSVVETIEKPVISNETNINATINLLEAARKWDSQIKNLFSHHLPLCMAICLIYLNQR